jgi:hypothetical protein
MVAGGDGAVDIFPRGGPFQIAASVVAFVAIHMIDLSAIRSEAKDKGLGDKDVYAHIPLKPAIAQLDI